MFLAKLKYTAAAVLAVAVATTGVRALVGPSPAQPTQGEPAAVPDQARVAQAPAPSPAAPSATQERNVERFQLDNGLKVILRPIQVAQSTALVVVYGIGSDHDPDGRSGLAHFVEHLYVTAAAGDTEGPDR